MNELITKVRSRNIKSILANVFSTSSSSSSVWGSITGTLSNQTDLQTALNAKQDLVTRVQSITSSATVTPNCDSYDMVKVTAQAAGLTLANPTGTPTEGQMMVIRIKDDGTARSITFDLSLIHISEPTRPY